MEQGTLTELENILDKDILVAEELKNLLQAEKSALVQRQPEELQRLLESKMKLLDKLEHNHQQKNQLASNHGIAGDSLSLEWESFLHQLQNRHQNLNVPLEKLEYFKEVLQQVESMNQVNAKIASRMEKSLSELINLLKGNIQKQALYTQHGNAESTTSAHTIAKA